MHPRLLDALSTILPSDRQTWLLQACLIDGAEGRQAWQRWCAEVGDPKTAFSGEWSQQKALLPLVHRLRAADAASENFRPYLQAAALHEELRSVAYRRVCTEVLAGLKQAAISCIVVKGAALAESVYPTPTLRHSHDIDLLVAPADLRRASQQLITQGLQLNSNSGAQTAHAGFMHVSGLPVAVHATPFRESHYGLSYAELESRSLASEIAGVTARVLSCEDQLLHLCGQAFCSGPSRSLLWACDAWFVLARASDFSWTSLYTLAERSHLALPVVLLVQYLAVQLGAPAPADLMARLPARGALIAGLDDELALHTARAAATGLRSLLQQSSDPIIKFWALRRMCFPSASYVRLVAPDCRTWQLPFWHAGRLLRYARRRLVPPSNL